MTDEQGTVKITACGHGLERLRQLVDHASLSGRVVVRHEDLAEIFQAYPKHLLPWEIESIKNELCQLVSECGLEQFRAALGKYLGCATLHTDPPPDGFPSWKDAAISERVRRVKAEKALEAPTAAPVQS